MTARSIRDQALLGARFVVVAFLLFAISFVASATPAFAHAQLIDTTPANATTVQNAPTQIRVHFGESITVEKRALKLFDSQGRALSIDRPRVVDSNTVVSDVSKLEPGQYVVTWRVVSADSHPVRGSFTFEIAGGEKSAAPSAIEDVARKVFNDDKADIGASVAYAIARAVSFGALFIGVGTLALLLVAQNQRRRLVAITKWSFAALAVSSICEIGLQGVDALGATLAALLTSEPWATSFDSRFGFASFVRALIAVALVAMIAIAHKSTKATNGESRGEDSPLFCPLFAKIAAALGIGGVVATTLLRHAPSGRLPVLGEALDIVHVTAASIWVGGLCALLFVVLSDVRNHEGEKLNAIAQLLQRFSTVALVCVWVIALSGVAQAWRQVGDIANLFKNAYGYLVLSKLGAFCLMLIPATFNRMALRHQFAQDETEETQETQETTGESSLSAKRIRVQVAIEFAIAVVVIVLTSLLVNSAPSTAKATSSALGFSAEVPVADRIAQVIVNPASQGQNEIHFYMLNSAGVPTSVEDLTLSISQPQKGIENLQIPLTRASGDHYITETASIPLKGTWTATARVQLTQFQSTSVDFKFKVD